MKNFHFGVRSNRELLTCHPDLQRVARKALMISQVDFGITDGHRSVREQQALFAEGRSQRDGVRKISMHNYKPALAFDIYIYVPGKEQELAYQEHYLCHVAGVIVSVGEEMFQKGEIGRPIIWGYNWDGDGEIGTDQRFQDMPHFQLGPTINEPLR